MLAKGEVSATVAHVTFRLEAFGAADETRLTHFSREAAFAEGRSTFSLALATTLPNDEDLFVVRHSQPLCRRTRERSKRQAHRPRRRQPADTTV